MDTLIHADIFFFVTTVVTVILGILLAIVLYYVTHIVRTVRDITQIVRDQADGISGDITAFRERARAQSGGVADVIRAVRGVFSSPTKEKVAKKKVAKRTNGKSN